MSVVFLLASAIALGEPEAGAAVSLQWSAPAGCPSADAVQRDVDALLGRGRAEGEPLVVEAEVAADRDGYVLRLVMETRTGRDVRRIRADACEQLARATSLIIATLQDPVAASDHVAYLQRPRADGPPTTPAPELPSIPVEEFEPRPPEPVSPSEAETRASERWATPWRAAIRLDGVAGSATLPRLDGGLAFAVGMTAPRIRLELGVSHMFAQTEAHPTLPNVGLRVRATTAVARGCGVLTWGTWEFPLCVAGELGATAAQGVGSAVREATVERAVYATALAEAHVVWRATDRFSIWAGAQGVLNLTRPSFTVDTLDPFFKAPLGGGRAKLGVEVRFP
ncbi:MAG: hypothetical protein ACRBN8_40400 [Nannocystales bacterium]